MTGFLEKILAAAREDLEERRREFPLSSLQMAPPWPAGRFREAVAAPGISAIAEIKRASPSKGDIRPDLRVPDIVREYEAGGARAISVLTESRFFKGSLCDLELASGATGLPLLRKDFIVDPYQVWEAAAAGAAAVLLIVAALEPALLAELLAEAAAASLDALVEVHTPAELETAVAAGASIIGINNRNLVTFEVSLDTTLDMIESIPDGVPVVSESGVRSREDVRALRQAGVDAVLVGEILMRSPRPGSKLAELIS